MLNKTPLETENISAIGGDLKPLLEQVGNHAEWASLTLAAASLRCPCTENLSTFRHQLHHYLHQLLLPVELPIIHQACQLTGQGAVRELITLDQSLLARPELSKFAAASQRVGRIHLRHLRPLRDQRVLQRYGQAVEQGQAQAWHTLVYGLILSIYSIPHRQGLYNYAHLTLRGFVHAGSRSLQLTETDEQHLLDELLTAVPTVLAALTASEPTISSRGALQIM